MNYPQDILSDYAAGRLDAAEADELERAAALDPELAAALAAACELDRRVRSRLNAPRASPRHVVALAGFTA